MQEVIWNSLSKGVRVTSAEAPTGPWKMMPAAQCVLRVLMPLVGGHAYCCCLGVKPSLPGLPSPSCSGDTMRSILGEAVWQGFC